MGVSTRTNEIVVGGADENWQEVARIRDGMQSSNAREGLTLWDGVRPSQH